MMSQGKHILVYASLVLSCVRGQREIALANLAYAPIDDTRYLQPGRSVRRRDRARSRAVKFKAGYVVASDVDDFELRAAQARHTPEGESVDPIGHDDVADQQIDERVALQNLKRQPIIRSDLHLVACTTQNLGRSLSEHLIVIDEEDAAWQRFRSAGLIGAHRGDLMRPWCLTCVRGR